MRMKNLTFFSYLKLLHLSFLYYLSCDESFLPLVEGEGEHKEISWNLILTVDYNTKKMQGRAPILDNGSCCFFK